MTTTEQLFCFLDLETTGLDSKLDEICEIAWAFTDSDFNVLGTPQTFVTQISHDGFTRIRRREIVRNMHEKSGLFAELIRDDGVPLDLAFKKLQMQLEDYTPSVGDELVQLAGLSIHFDKRMIEAAGWMSLFEDWRTDIATFHHRLYDLSSVKIAMRNANAPFDTPENKGAHRALNDVFETIEQARIFRTRLEGLGL